MTPYRSHPLTLWLIAFGLSAVALSCANRRSGPGARVEPLPGEAAIGLGRGETLPPFTPQKTAEKNWVAGEEAFKDEDYVLSARYYVFIRRNFPYSRYAVLSDLRLADVQYQRRKWLPAIDAYTNFSRLHPTHSQVPYALFRLSKAHYELIPSDWFFLPPTHEKDQSAARDTAKAFATYLKRFPEDTQAEEARKLQGEVRRRLLAHERYVANFYKRLGRVAGYIGRLEAIKTRFPDVGLNPELLLELVHAYAEARDKTRATQTLDELKSTYPDAEKAFREGQMAVKTMKEAPARASKAKTDKLPSSAPSPGS